MQGVNAISYGLNVAAKVATLPRSQHHVAAIGNTLDKRRLSAFCHTAIKAVERMCEQTGDFAPSLRAPLHGNLRAILVWQGIGQHRFEHQIKGFHQGGIAIRFWVLNRTLMCGQRRDAPGAGGKGLRLLVRPNWQRGSSGAHGQQGGATEKAAEGRAC